MYKKFLILVLVLLGIICAIPTAYAESEGVSLEVLSEGKVILREEVYINPDFLDLVGEDRQGRIRELNLHYGEVELLDYLFGDLGSRVKVLFDKMDELKIEECIDFNPKKQNKFLYHAEHSARKVDRGSFFESVISQIDQKRILVNLEFQKIEPRITDSELKEHTKLLSEYSTDYRYSKEGRKKNIALASSFLSGCVIKGGENISFNQTVGKRTAERGFEGGKVIQNGEFVDGVGGGVCQVATTLYNSAIRCGLEPIKWCRHTLAPSYVPLSFDAMVSEWSDLELKNTGNTPVFLECLADGEKITVRFYGKERTGGERLDFVSVVKEVIRHPDWTEDSTKHKNGYKSEGYKLRFRGEELLSKELIRTDIYQPYEIKED